MFQFPPLYILFKSPKIVCTTQLRSIHYQLKKKKKKKMATSIIIGSFRGFFIPKQSFIRPKYLMLHPRRSASISRAASSTIDTQVDLMQDLTIDADICTSTDRLACPICYYPLLNTSGQTRITTSGSNVECSTCKKSYVKNEIYLDLTIAGGSKDYGETMPVATELFRTPLVSFLYERGWRQNFVWGGFPGPQKEFEMAKSYLKPTQGGKIVDASCGSGLFSRLFVKSEMYSLVIALDFSENMLRQCDEFIKQENISKENLILVRADISRLPFVSGSIDAVHAGAALHCWPSPSDAVAEISRVLRPGGVFVATTFILDVFYPAVPVLRALREVYTRASSNHLFLSERELEELCRACGLIGFTCTRNGPFVMISATKTC